MGKEKNVKKLIETLLHTMGIQFDGIEEVQDPFTQKKVFKIKSPESGLLIGDHGETFQALSHIIRILSRKDLEEIADFSVDINDYRAGMVEKLKVTAGILANRARDMKTNVEMEPMSSYERLIIHGTLSGEANIKTESIGEGKNRRLIIKYIATDL